jgi:hypothetical protein
MVRAFYLSLAASLVLVFAAETQAVLVQTQIFSETFNTNTTNLGTTVAAYPAWSGIAGGGNISVTGNQLQINKSGANEFLTNQTFNEEIWVKVDMGGVPNPGVSNGQYATALVIGNRAFQFFPGCCGGALRIYDFNPITGNIGTQLSTPGDIVMPGFTPSSNVMHHIELHSNNLGTLDLKFTNGSNPLNIYTQSFTFGGFVPGRVGFSALHGSNISSFDNLTISALREEVLPAPEPTSVALLGLGGMVLISVSRSRRRKHNVAATASENSSV